MVLAGFFSFFRQVPGFAPVAAVGVKFQGRVGGGDLVLGCGQSGALRGVFAFAADRTFGGVVHREAFQNSHHGLLVCSKQNLSCQLSEMVPISLTAQSWALSS